MLQECPVCNEGTLIEYDTTECIIYKRNLIRVRYCHTQCTNCDSQMEFDYHKKVNLESIAESKMKFDLGIYND